MKYLYKKVFMIIKFFLDRFGVFYAKDHIYEIIGKIVEEKALDQKVDYTYLKNFMTFAISKTFEIILDKKDPTLKEALIYLIKDTYPIYIMNNYSIGPINSKLTERSEIFTNIDPSTANHLKYLEKKEKLELRMLKKVTDTGKDIYFGYVSGPLTKEDDEVIKTLKRKIEEI